MRPLKHPFSLGATWRPPTRMDRGVTAHDSDVDLFFDYEKESSACSS
jgi:hypothetical protein